MDLIERNKELMKKFETMINTADEKLAEELVASDAPFYTPASPEPLYGGKGYLSVVHWMRKGFSNVQWHIKDMVADNEKVAVNWTLTGTHDGEFMGAKATGKNICYSWTFLRKSVQSLSGIMMEQIVGIGSHTRKSGTSACSTSMQNIKLSLT